ncbi:MAG: hypothetical protein UHM85_08885 [Acutalibacteraceae bacterium]|nr:hypothetical protein [Acutalibacteraceae bacterium]
MATLGDVINILKLVFETIFALFGNLFPKKEEEGTEENTDATV